MKSEFSFISFSICSAICKLGESFFWQLYSWVLFFFINKKKTCFKTATLYLILNIQNLLKISWCSLSNEKYKYDSFQISLAPPPTHTQMSNKVTKIDSLLNMKLLISEGRLKKKYWNFEECENAMILQEPWAIMSIYEFLALITLNILKNCWSIMHEIC